MDVKELTDWAVYAGTVAGALIALGVVLRYTVLRPVMRYLRESIGTPVRQVAAEIGASAQSEEDGPTLKDLVIAYGYRLSSLEQRFDDHLRKDHHHHTV